MTDKPVFRLEKPINKSSSSHVEKKIITPLECHKSPEIPKNITDALDNNLNPRAAHIAYTGIAGISQFLQESNKLKSKSEENLREPVVEAKQDNFHETTVSD